MGLTFSSHSICKHSESPGFSYCSDFWAIKTVPSRFLLSCTTGGCFLTPGFTPGGRNSSSAAALANMAGWEQVGECLTLMAVAPNGLQGSSAACLPVLGRPGVFSHTQPSLQSSKEINTHVVTLSGELTSHSVWAFFHCFLALSAHAWILHSVYSGAQLGLTFVFSSLLSPPPKSA